MRKLSFLRKPQLKLINLFLVSQVFLVFEKLHAQVHVGDLTLSTQAQVDAFNFTEVTGILFINDGPSGNITNLNGLSELTKIGHGLLITDNRFLTDISGLQNLTSVGEAGGASGLFITDNNILTTLNGLSNLTWVRNLSIGDNPMLTSIAALSNLTHLTHVSIKNNDALTSIDALFQVTSTGDIVIEENLLLQDLGGFTNLTWINGRLGIKDNPALTNIDGLSNVTSINGFVNFFSNGALTGVNLSKLVSVEGAFSILFCSALTNVDGLAKLVRTKEGFLLNGNNSLLHVDGLSSLIKVKHLNIENNNNLQNLDGLLKLNEVEEDLKITGNDDLVDFCGLTHLFTSGSIGGDIDITNNGSNTVNVYPTDVIVNAEPGICTATVTAAMIGSPTIDGCLVPITVTHTPIPASASYPVGTSQILWSATDGAGNTATAVQNIVVIDNQAPQITAKPEDITVECAADVPVASVAGVTAIDNCSVSTINISDAITNQACANRYILTRTFQAVDPAGNSTTAAQVITVQDDQPPQLSNPAPSQVSLWPPNHTMRDITVNYAASDNCASDVQPVITITSNEPVNGVADGDTDPDWEIIDAHHIRLRSERAANGNGRIYTITVTINDGCNPAVSKTTEVHVAHNITNPHSGNQFRIGSAVNFAGEFWDRPGNKHTAKWSIDNASVKGSVTEPTTNKNGKVIGSYKFTSPGVYKIQMNITDQSGITSYSNTNGDLEAIVVIYDPNGGYTYGGGWFASQAGALTDDPTAEGKASYGFTVNYFKTSTFPKGETQFEFKVGSLEFNALNFDYLVINGAKAQFRGTGKITGDQSGYGFIMTVIDGNLDGSGVDKIRMKIYNKNNNHVIYDNQAGASDAADPVVAVGDNSSIVIYSTTNLVTQNRIEQEPVNHSFDVRVSPNPAKNEFTLKLSGDEMNEPVKLEVVDAYGRFIEEKIIPANSTTRFGAGYLNGIYFLRISQGKSIRQVKLIKLLQ
jgi:hypothetical protein